MAGLIILDASVLIALLRRSDANHSWAQEFFKQTTDSDWGISSLTLAEVLVYPSRTNAAESLLGDIAGLHLHVFGMDESEAVSLAKLRASTGLKMPDAVVLQLAISQAAALATLDQTLKTRARELDVRVFCNPRTI